MSEPDFRDDDDCPAYGISAHQRAAVESPAISLAKLVAAARPAKMCRPVSTGNFHRIDHLLEQFASTPIIELGQPLPNSKYVPRWRKRAGRCHAAHNRALFGDSE